MRLILASVALLGVMMPGLVVGAQPPARGGDLDAANIAPAEIQRLFDAYALVQAQEVLKLGDDQFPMFLARYKGLQEVRRRLSGGAHAAHPGAGASVGSRRQIGRCGSCGIGLKALQDLDARIAVDIRKAYEGIDQVLDLRQQARFRGFEEQMERRKIELVTRARQNNRANNRPNAGRRGQP